MTDFAMSNTIPADIADNGTVRMGGGVHCQLIGCLTHPAVAPVVTHAHGLLHAVARFLFG